MPKIRIGFSTDFNLVNEQVGIGTTNPESRLNVPGQILADNTAGSGGVSTYREYQGFHQTQSNVSHKVTIDATTAGNLNSLSGELRIDGDVTIASDTSVTSGKIDSLTATDKFAVPLGETNNRDNAPEAGTTRFNQDFGTLEFFDGANWKTVNSYARGGAAGRGVFGGSGNDSSSYGNTMDYIQIMSTGNAIDFGDMTVTVYGGGGCGSETRANFFGGRLSPGGSGYTDRIDSVTIASSGGGVDYGDLVGTTVHTAGCSSSTRGFKVGAYNYDNDIEFWEIATGGQAIDFSHLTSGRHTHQCFSSPTRAFAAGGSVPGDTRANSVDMFNMASKGTDASDFGDMTSRRGENPGTTSNSVRAIIGGGMDTIGRIKSMEYLTMSTTGSFISFGDLTTPSQGSAATATSTRAVFGGGHDGTSKRNVIDYVTISSLGGAIDFGDMVEARSIHGATSDSHGGLGGF